MADTGEVQVKSKGYKKINPEAGKATRFKKGQSGNPNGQPKGSKHINTWIQELLEDEEFEAQIQEGYKIVEYKGAPIRAIIKAQMTKAVNGDTKAFDSLAKYGWSQKQEIDTRVEVVTPILGGAVKKAIDVPGDDDDA